MPTNAMGRLVSGSRFGRACGRRVVAGNVPQILRAVSSRLCEQVAGDLQRKGCVGKTIGIKIRYDDFKGVTRDQTLDTYTGDARTIRQVAGQCLKRVPLTQRLRLLCVRVASLAKLGEFPLLCQIRL